MYTKHKWESDRYYNFNYVKYLPKDYDETKKYLSKYKNLSTIGNPIDESFFLQNKEKNRQNYITARTVPSLQMKNWHKLQ